MEDMYLCFIRKAVSFFASSSPLVIRASTTKKMQDTFPSVVFLQRPGAERHCVIINVSGQAAQRQDEHSVTESTQVKVTTAVP